LIMPFDENFEISLFTTIFQGFAYLFMMFLANLFYYLGYAVDNAFNINNNDHFRRQLFNFGFLFSILLPFLIPLMIVIMYFIEFSH
jgi:hypothetical protein